jgi:hypothetical protein
VKVAREIDADGTGAEMEKAFRKIVPPKLPAKSNSESVHPLTLPSAASGNPLCQLNRALRHIRQVKPLSGKMRVGFLKRYGRGTSRGFLRSCGQFEVAGDPFLVNVFCARVRTHGQNANS